MVTPEQVIAPQGEVEHEVMFPGDSPEDFAARIAGYVHDANKRAGDNADAARAWAYHRAFSAVATRLMTMPTSATLAEGGSYSHMVTQLTIAQQRAQFWLDAFDTAMAPVIVVEGVMHGAVRTVIS
jgi:hypothetical protein